jgi:hypothetical protein
MSGCLVQYSRIGGGNDISEAQPPLPLGWRDTNQQLQQGRLETSWWLSIQAIVLHVWRQYVAVVGRQASWHPIEECRCTQRLKQLFLPFHE